jgi:TRPM family ion channel
MREVTIAAVGAVVRPTSMDEIASSLEKWGLTGGRPTLVLVGGADGVGPQELVRLRPLFGELARALDRIGAAVVDGGTDAGVMRLLGQERGRERASFPLIGVVPDALVSPSRSDGIRLEPNHTHVMLVPGSEWGDEAPWLVRAAEIVGGRFPMLTLLVNGGDLALREVEASVSAGRRVLVVDRTGRAAEQLAAAMQGAPSNPRLRALADSGLVEVASPDGSASVVERVETILGVGGHGS